MTLIDAMIAVAILGIIVAAVAQTTKTGVYTARGLADREEIAVIRRAVEDNLSCRKTLKVTPTTPLPLPCDGVTYFPLRDFTGALINTGTWQLRGICQNNQLIVSVTKPSKDFLTSQDWSSRKTANDLFDGLGSFCTELFRAADCQKQPQYPVLMGVDTNGPKCCRVKQATNPTTKAWVRCNANEYVMMGSHVCGDPSAAAPPNVVGYKMLRSSVLSGNAWGVDCRSNDANYPVPSTAIALCCPL